MRRILVAALAALVLLASPAGAHDIGYRGHGDYATREVIWQYVDWTDCVNLGWWPGHCHLYREWLRTGVVNHTIWVRA